MATHCQLRAIVCGCKNLRARNCLQGEKMQIVSESACSVLVRIKIIIWQTGRPGTVGSNEAIRYLVLFIKPYVYLVEY